MIDNFDQYVFVGEYDFSFGYGFDQVDRVEILDTANPYSLNRVGLLNVNVLHSADSASTFDITKDRFFMALGQDGFVSTTWNIHQDADSTDDPVSTDNNDNSDDTSSPIDEDNSTTSPVEGDATVDGFLPFYMGPVLLTTVFNAVYQYRVRQN